ncbi:MAG: methyltransferase [Clostridia bacterium]|nr:methyltransferase [Clostridia bacterium]
MNNGEIITPINERITLIQRAAGLTFGTDAYLLGAFVRGKSGGRAVELGGGTGVVSLLCAARDRFASILCAEIQPEYVSLIARNAEGNGLSSRVLALRKDVRDLTVKDTGGEVHAVFSNPPYLRADCGFTNDSPEKNAARREENGTVRDFCQAAARILRWGGCFTAVYRPERMTELFCSLRESGLEPKRAVFVHPAPDAPPSLLLTEAKKGAAEGLVFSRPLFVYADRERSVYTDDMQAVYDTFSLSHLF